jgi:hypothetical protein
VQERLLDPHVGDLVEVAWKGKFRLESLDIYQGLAWWSAIVVDKSDGSRCDTRHPPCHTPSNLRCGERAVGPGWGLGH